MATKYYRVKTDCFLWNAGAIIEFVATLGTKGGYTAVEDIWDAVPEVEGEFISAPIIESETNAKFFERVYPDTIAGKIFRTKDQIVRLYQEGFRE